MQFDFDIDGILHVSAVDRGSGKQARTTVRATHAHLSPADIASARDEMETLAWEDWDRDEPEAAIGSITVGAEPSFTTAGLLARARRVAARGTGDTDLLETAIAALEAAVQRGDQAAVEAQSEELLDLLYDLDEA